MIRFLHTRLLLLSLFISSGAFCQIKGVVIDSLTKEKVPFVNIWSEGEAFKTISNGSGIFILETTEKTKTLLFSAVGYKTKKIEISIIRDTIVLKPKIIELNEVVLRNSKKRKKEKVISKIKKAKIGHYLIGPPKSGMYARYFAFNDKYKETPYLTKIRVATNSPFENLKFYIRLQAVNKKGEPEGYIYDESILVTVKKGKKLTEVNISSLNITFPENGFFVVVDWLRIDQNKGLFDTYLPTIGFMQLETDANSWYYTSGGWKKIWKNGGERRDYRNKYNLLAAEIVLSN